MTTDLTTTNLTTTDLSTTAAAPAADLPAIGVAVRLHRDETGSQAMEYSALAAGGCGIVGLLVALWESDAVQDRVEGLITGLIDTVTNGITDLLPF